MERPWESVYTVHEYWDGPVAGFADYNGVAHAYRSAYRADLEEHDPRFRLVPVSSNSLALALEDWSIWRRWEDAFYAGEATGSSHGALSEDAARRRELAPVMDRILDVPADGCLLATAEFRVLPGPGPERAREMEVRWTPVARAEPEARAHLQREAD